jgi:hypothetical protein
VSTTKTVLSTLRILDWRTALNACMEWAGAESSDTETVRTSIVHSLQEGTPERSVCSQTEARYALILASICD